jgi:hypothetical protein
VTERWIALSLVAALLWQVLFAAGLGAVQQPSKPNPNPRPSSLTDDLDRSYLDLFPLAPTLHITATQIQEVRDQLKKDRDKCGDRFKQRSSEYDREIKAAQEELRSQSGTLPDSQHHDLQADQVGIEHAWNGGDDPTGFIRFFDKMATKVGFVNATAWFYDHPPFYERMVEAEREIMLLPKKPKLLMQTTAFLNMKKELAQYEAKSHVLKVPGEQAGQPQLVIHEAGCSKPHEIVSKPGESVEALCSSISKTSD